jgi:hypothetical protein
MTPSKYIDQKVAEHFSNLKHKRYVGTKIIDAAPMTRGTYNEVRGWECPPGEDPFDMGFIVRYSDGYVSWSPEDTFREAYHPTEGVPFGIAIELAKRGEKVARAGWNGKNMFVVYQKGYPDGIPCNKQTAEAFGMKEGELFKCRPYLQMRCADGSHQMWLASQSDILENDWVIVQ